MTLDIRATPQGVSVNLSLLRRSKFAVIPPTRAWIVGNLSTQLKPSPGIPFHGRPRLSWSVE